MRFEYKIDSNNRECDGFCCCSTLSKLNVVQYFELMVR